jgi:hypothetical protein
MTRLLRQGGTLGSRFNSTGPMLRQCIAPECTTIVFGHGTCIQHDGRESAVPAIRSATVEQRPAAVAVREAA